MSRRRMHQIPKTDPASLLEVSRELPPFALAGFETGRGRSKLNLMDIPPDDRASMAGLFGVHAPRSWLGVAVKIEGTARHLQTAEKVGTATSVIVVTRDRQIATHLNVDGDDIVDVTVPSGGPDAGCGAAQHGGPEGLVIDSLHRVLGLQCPGPDPDPAELVMRLWISDMLTVLAQQGGLSWTQMAGLHPLAGHNPLVPPSGEMIVEATCRSSDQVNWKRIHHRAIAAGEPSGGLEPDEIRWMDPKMYARWTLSYLPEATGLVRALVERGCDNEATLLVETIEQITIRKSQPDAGADHRTDRRSA